MVVYSAFRDGNVPYGFRQLGTLGRALELFPAGIEKIRLRMDTQGYEWRLLRHLAGGGNPRLGAIEFAVGADMTPELKKAVTRL